MLIRGNFSVAMVVFVLMFWALPVQAGEWEDRYPGVQYLETVMDGPVQAWAIKVDLCAQGVSLRATRGDEKQRTTSAFGRQVGAQVAINGGFYEPDFAPTGFAMGDGEVWSDDIRAHGFIGFGAEGAVISAPRQQVSEPPEGMSEAVGGYDLVLDAGVVPEMKQRFCKARHPRTAAGLSEDGKALYLGVVDGRSEASRGMTCGELGRWMRDLGAYRALNLDGGGSTTLWMDGEGVINRPSAGAERVVSNHLAVMATGEGAPSSCPVAWQPPEIDEAEEPERQGVRRPDGEKEPSDDGDEVVQSRQGGRCGVAAPAVPAVVWVIGMVAVIGIRRINGS